MIFNTNGIITQAPIDGKFWLQKDGDNFILKENDLTYEIEAECIRIYDLLTIKTFGSFAKYNSILNRIPFWVKEGGIDAEFKVSKLEFEKLVTESNGNSQVNKFLYFYDCRNLIATIQNTNIEIKLLFGEFFKQLNENDFLINDISLIEDGLQYSSGLMVSNIFSTLNHLFISLHSVMDFVTKLCLEIENFHSDFSSYPRLKSSNKLYGDRKKIKSIETKDTIFEQSETINTIISIRNEIIHNSSIDNLPKVYQRLDKGKIIEKFILIPDLNNGTIVTLKNRKRFFDNDTKVNELLPNLIYNFWSNLKQTLMKIK